MERRPQLSPLAVAWDQSYPRHEQIALIALFFLLEKEPFSDLSLVFYAASSYLFSRGRL